MAELEVEASPGCALCWWTMGFSSEAGAVPWPLFGAPGDQDPPPSPDPGPLGSFWAERKVVVTGWGPLHQGHVEGNLAWVSASQRGHPPSLVREASPPSGGPGVKSWGGDFLVRPSPVAGGLGRAGGASDSWGRFQSPGGRGREG